MYSPDLCSSVAGYETTHFVAPGHVIFFIIDLGMFLEKIFFIEQWMVVAR